MFSRREFLQYLSVMGGLFSTSSFPTIASPKNITEADLLKFDSKGQVTLLHITDMHAQLKPIYFRPPSENYGVGDFEGIPPHLVGSDFLQHFAIKKKYAFGLCAYHGGLCKPCQRVWEIGGIGSNRIPN